MGGSEELATDAPGSVWRHRGPAGDAPGLHSALSAHARAQGPLPPSRAQVRNFGGGCSEEPSPSGIATAASAALGT